MTDKEIRLNLLDNFAGSFWWTIHKLSLDALRWQPDTEANSITVTYQPATAYACIRAILMDTREHLGEIKALKAWWERKS